MALMSLYKCHVRPEPVLLAKRLSIKDYEGLRPVRYISDKYLISGADQNVKLVLNPLYTVKPVLRGHSKIDKRNILMINGSLIKVESIAECSL